jgi:hypothetical protein
MLKINRRLRRELFDKMNLKKYLLYTFGEVLLVMIGLLLAIQVNSWNAKRIDRNTEKEYLGRLSNELKSEIEMYSEVRDKFIEKEKRLKRIIRIWQSGNNSITDSLQYINDFKWGGNIGPWFLEPVTWNQLIQTGELKLLRDHKLVDEMFYHNNLAKGVADNYLMHPMQMTNRAREVWIEPFLYENTDIVIDTGEVSVIPSTEVYENIWKNREMYLKLYMEIVFISKMQHQQLQSIIDSGQKLLTLLPH